MTNSCSSFFLHQNCSAIIVLKIRILKSMNEELGLNDQIVPSPEDARRVEAIPIRHGYKLTFDSRAEAEGFIKDFWTETFPQTESYFKNGMWNTAIHDQLTHNGERTDFYIGTGGPIGEVGQFTVLLAGNGQMLQPKSVDWLVGAGYLKAT